MKKFILQVIQAVLKTLAQWTIGKYKPGIIGVTGSVGKTGTKEAIYTVLRNIRKARMSRGNFNSEIGLPLTILGDWPDTNLHLLSREAPPGKNKFRKALFILKVILTSAAKLAFGSRSAYPEILVLEYGADKPGDMEKLLDIAKPQMSVITAIGTVPVHVEFYSGPHAVAREKCRLIEHLPSHGFAIVNGDDETVFALKDKTRAHVITFGFNEGVELRITNFENRIENGLPKGISFKLNYGGSFVPVRIDGCFGKPSAYAAAAAASVGIVFGIHLVRISEALIYYEGPPHRMKLIPGIKNTLIIDDSYNASPLSMESAIETVRSLAAARKVGILGDMLEIGKYSIQAHEEVGKLAAKVFDVLLTVGPRGKFIADAAKQAGLSRRNIVSVDNADEAILPLEDLLKKGDLVLIKGSHAMHLEKIAREIRQL